MKEYVDERELMKLAKQYREAAGVTRAQAARELGIKHPSIFNAEETPEQSLLKTRIRLVEKYSPYEVIGPVFLLKKK